MSKVTYLLGAGASYGSRDNSKIIRGVPVISEFSNAIQELIDRMGKSPNMFEYSNSPLTETEYKELKSWFKALKRICDDYPTVDTYAKQLFITNEDASPEYFPIKTYEDLKRILSVFLLMIQDVKKRDIRYDGFIASVIKEGRVFPSMTILSWNYDAQFEMAFSGYAKNGKYIPFLWEELNTKNKTYKVCCENENPFSMIKLNGTAFFTTGDTVHNNSGNTIEQIADVYFGGDNTNWMKKSIEFIKHPYNTSLSYVWEAENRQEIISEAKKKIVDTKDLIVIGYSFPYVNSEIDEELFNAMPKLRNIYIQDPKSKEIHERVEVLLSKQPRRVRYTIHEMPESKTQFYIPGGFE